MVFFGQKKPEYTNHARKRMKERNVTKAEVEFVLNNPEYTLPGDCETIKMIAHPNGRKVKIVVPKDNDCRIKTVAAD
jgi:hypothetical protein